MILRKQMKATEAEDEKPKETTSLADDPEKVEQIWDSFKKDVESSSSKKAPTNSTPSVTSPQDQPTPAKVFEFAGESVA